MKEKRNRASRGHGGVVYQRGLHEALVAYHERKLKKKLDRINRHPRRRVAARTANWLTKLARRIKRPVGKPRVVEPVETLQ